MTFLDNLILATLNEWQGTTLTAEKVASIINVSDVNKVRISLDRLTDSHYPVIKTEQGYTIPKDSIRDYIGGVAVLTVIALLPLWIM